MIEIDYTFEIETDPESKTFLWWASCHVGGTLAVAGGATPWLALAACIANIPRTVEWCRSMDAALERAKAGTYKCPGCGDLRPPLSAAECYFFFCDACRDDVPPQETGIA
jgi:hypothetical protein